MSHFNTYYNEAVQNYIDTLPFQNLWVKIIILDNQDQPLKDIEGRATDGTITVNGSSSIRRTGSLTIVTKREALYTDTPLEIMHQVSNLETLIAINKRARIEVGIENSGALYQDVPMFWFSLGHFILSSASVTYDQNGIQISVKLNDKMALLNGEAGGTFPASTTLSPDRTTNLPLAIYDLIYYLLTSIGGLQPHEFEIEDVPKTINSITRWAPNLTLPLSGAIETEKLYLCRERNASHHGVMTNLPCATPEDIAANNNNPNRSVYRYLLFTEDRSPQYTVPKIFEKTDVIGYAHTEFTYPSQNEFKVNGGATVEQALTTIKNTLGNFEFFFDVDGIFHFREIKDNKREGSAFDDLTKAIGEQYFIMDTSAYTKEGVYNINDKNIITSYANNPKYDQVKNDFNVWGKHPSTKGDIHYHLFFSNEPKNDENNLWKITFEPNKDNVTKSQQPYMPTAIEPQTIDQMPPDMGGALFKIVPASPSDNYEVYLNLSAGQQVDANGAIWYRPDEAWRIKMYCLGGKKTFDAPRSGIPTVFETEVFGKLYQMMYLDPSNSNTFLRLKDPADVTFSGYWVDRVDVGSPEIQATAEIKDFGIENIGRRTKVVTESKVNTLFFTDHKPKEGDYYIDLIGNAVGNSHLFNDGWFEAIQVDDVWYKMIHVPPVDTTKPKKDDENYKIVSHLVPGNIQNPAYDHIRAMLQDHLSYNNDITLSTIPIYHLEPNTLMRVSCPEADINGLYLINSFTIPLTLSGTMSINAKKAAKLI